MTVTINACVTCRDPCCTRTTYLLTTEDIEELNKVRQLEAIFDATIRNPDGTIQLKQPCRFLDKDNRCTVYDHRPAGCRIYPIVFKEGMYVDPSCPGHTEVPYWKAQRYTLDVQLYLMRIRTQAKERVGD